MFAYIIGLIAGASQTTQTSVNTNLSQKLKSPYLASVVSFTTGLIWVGIILALLEKGIYLPLTEISKEPFWIWGGGICGVGIVTLNILCLPKLGSAWTVMLLSFGQIMTGLVIDNWGLFGSQQIPMNAIKAAGAALLIAGVALVSLNKKSDGKTKMPVLYMVLAILAGMLCTLQVAINGRLTTVAGSSWRSTFISMSMGTCGCLILVALLVLLRGRKGVLDETMPDVDFHWYQLLGGFFAVVIVGSNAIAAPIIGTGIVTIMNLIAQMIMGLIVDATGFLGIEKQAITTKKIIGILLMLAGTVIIMML